MQLAVVNGIRRTIIQTSENRKISGSTSPAALIAWIQLLHRPLGWIPFSGMAVDRPPDTLPPIILGACGGPNSGANCDWWSCAPPVGEHFGGQARAGWAPIITGPDDHGRVPHSGRL
jgi:hypothetical protein